MVIRNLDIFWLIKDHINEGYKEKCVFLENYFTNILGKNYTIPFDFKFNIVKGILKTLKERWNKKKRNLKNFLKGHADWLEKNVHFPKTAELIDEDILENKPSKKLKVSMENKNEKNFYELSHRSQNRLSKERRESDSSPEIDTYSAAYKFRKQGNKEAFLVLNDIACNSPITARKYRESYLYRNFLEAGSLTPEQALAHMLDCQLSKNKYQIARNTFVKLKNPGYPAYNQVSKAKTACYPENITVKGYKAHVSLQSLCNHTAERLFKYLDTLINRLTTDELRNLRLYFKYGSDGSSSQSNYKQNFVTENGDSVDDSSLYVSSLAPLQLVTIAENGSIKKVLWMNDKPSSPMYCRPISVQFIKESTEYIKEERTNLENQIANIESHTINILSTNIKVCYQFFSTMYDVKSINAMTNTLYTKECYICGLRDKDLSDVDKTLETPINKSNLRYGISSLHAWIRCFECLVHLSYKLSICQPQARKNDGTKDIVEEHKVYIQQRFKSELNLRVDQPKQIAGNSNDGNTARMFFNNEEKAAEITGIKVEIIRKFHVILETLSSGHIIDHEKYKEYAVETARLLKEKYPWFIISPTVHKVLLHGAEIIEDAVLPIGQLSEEAAEATNKYIRQFRLFFTRKSDRKETMNDLFCRLLANSDPFISNLRHSYKKRFRSLSSEARKMLKAPEIDEEEIENDECDVFFNMDEEEE